jgi:hypothetical protein
MSVAENKARLDQHAERLRGLEIVVGRNGLVRASECAGRHDHLESRMDRMERKVGETEKRQLAILVGVILTLVALVVNLAVRVT